MKHTLRRLRLFAINLLVLVALCELASTAYYYAKDGAYLSVQEKLTREQSSFDTELSGKLPCNKHGNVLAPHPYLVFIHPSRPECRSPSNNTGHRGPDLPYRKNPNDYFVMVLGGSVANQLYQFRKDDLQTYFQQKHPDKRVTVFNGSLEGWKQPQQLFMLQLYGEQLDEAISIEGFNEMMFNRRLDYRLRFDTPFLPGYRKANPGLQNPEEQLGIAISRWLFDAVNSNGILRHSKTAYFISDQARRGLEQRVNRADDKNDIPPQLKHLESVLQLPTDWSREQRVEHHLQQYLKYLDLMKSTADTYGVRLTVFLQPSPALYKPLSPEEQSVVGDLDYRDDYQRLEKSLLAHSGKLPVFSLLDVFSNHPENIYKDGIHYHRNSMGPELMMQRIYQTLDGRR